MEYVPRVTTRPRSRVKDWVGEMGEVGADMQTGYMSKREKRRHNGTLIATQISTARLPAVPLFLTSSSSPPAIALSLLTSTTYTLSPPLHLTLAQH